MARGGQRDPGVAKPPSGPGAYSQRTEGQKVASPRVGDSSDLNSGDRQLLQNAMKAQPLPSSGPPAKPSTQGGGGIGPMRGDVGTDDITSMLSRPSNRPSEPGTHGLSSGPGGGPEVLPPQPPVDDKEAVLFRLIGRFSSPTARQFLSGIQSERQGMAQGPMQAPPTPGQVPVQEQALEG